MMLLSECAVNVRVRNSNSMVSCVVNLVVATLTDRAGQTDSETYTHLQPFCQSVSHFDAVVVLIRILPVTSDVNIRASVSNNKLPSASVETSFIRFSEPLSIGMSCSYPYENMMQTRW